MKKPQIAVIIRILLVALGLCALLSCGKNPFSPSTDVGKNIVDDVDPSVTNVNDNIKIFRDSVVVDSSFSMRDVGDSILLNSHRAMSALDVGTFSGIQANAKAFLDTSYGYIEFRPGLLRQSGYEGNRTSLKTAYAIDSVVLMVNRFRMTIDSNSAARTAEVSVFACDTMYDTASVSFSRNKISDPSKASGTFAVSLDSAAADTVYSVKLDSSYITRFKQAVSDSAVYQGDTAWFALCLKPGPANSHVVRFDNLYDIPRMQVYFRTNQTDTAASVVTLNRHHVTYSVFEQDSAAACGHPFSSWETGRRAVLKLGISSLRNYMDTAAGAGKKFVAVQRADLKIRFSGIVSDLQVDSVLVLYCVSDTPLTNMRDFSQVSTFYVRAGDSILTLPMASWLQKTAVKQNSEKVYFYLAVPTQSHVYSPPFVHIDWTQPQVHLELNAVVSNPREK